MSGLLSADLDKYSRLAVAQILLRFPGWEPFGIVSPRPDGAGSTVDFTIPCPSPAVESGLWVSTADDEFSVGFHTHHGHFTDYETPLNARRIEEGLEQAGAYLEDRCGVVSWYEADRLAGTTSCGLPLGGPLPRVFANLPVTRGTLRSWSGRYDRDEQVR